MGSISFLLDGTSEKFYSISKQEVFALTFRSSQNLMGTLAEIPFYKVYINEINRDFNISESCQGLAQILKGPFGNDYRAFKKFFSKWNTAVFPSENSADIILLGRTSFIRVKSNAPEFRIYRKCSGTLMATFGKETGLVLSDGTKIGHHRHLEEII